MLRDETILITGPTSQVAFPIARELAKHNRVYGLARFSKATDRERVEKLGVTPLAVDLAKDSLDTLPEDVSLVLHFAVVKTGDFDYDLEANVEGTGRLYSRCRGARAFLHCSSAAVYEPAQGRAHPESDPLGDSHRSMFPTYSIAKIASESMARYAAREWNVPTTIMRLNVPYGDNGGWPWYHLMMMKSGVEIPIHPAGPNRFNMLHEDDYLAQIPKLVEIASVPATTLNWGGEVSSIEEWCAYLGELTGLEPRLVKNESATSSNELDLSRMHELIGPATTPWRDGIRRLVEARNPELLKG